MEALLLLIVAFLALLGVYVLVRLALSLFVLAFFFVGFGAVIFIALAN